MNSIPERVITHRDTCPVSKPDHVLDLTRNTCNCDFGKRMQRWFAEQRERFASERTP